MAVEVLSESNTKTEMDDKLQKYFEAGVQLVWYFDPETQSARAFTSLTEVAEFDKDGILDGGDVLPGFQLSLRQLYEEANRQGPRA